MLNTIDAGLRSRAELRASDIQHKVLSGEASARRPDLVIDAPDATAGRGPDEAERGTGHPALGHVTLIMQVS